MAEPTIKQKDFAQDIGYELGIDPPFGEDEESYHKFINDNVNEFYKQRNKRRHQKWYRENVEEKHLYDRMEQKSMEEKNEQK